MLSNIRLLSGHGEQYLTGPSIKDVRAKGGGGPPENGHERTGGGGVAESGHPFIVTILTF